MRDVVNELKTKCYVDNLTKEELNTLLDYGEANPNHSPRTKPKGLILVEYLKQSGIVGQVYPWRQSEQHLEPMYALVWPIKNALDQVRHMFKKDITLSEFKKYLKSHKIEVYKDVNDPRWINREQVYAKEYSRKTVEEKQKEIEDMESNKDRLKVISKHLNTSEKRISNGKIVGRRGHIHHNDQDHWTLKAEARSKRHFSGIKKRLAFMDIKTDNDTGGEFAMKRMPTPSEAEYIRDVVGLKQRPANATTQLAA